MLKNQLKVQVKRAANYYFYDKKSALLDKVKTTCERLIQEKTDIPDDRKMLLDELGIYLAGRLIASGEVSLLFICTHNSRRSIMAQIWAQTAADYYEIKNVKSYSGGTQKTAFNPNAVAALKQSGFKIKMLEEGANPKYKVRFSKTAKPLICFSKKFNHKKNPQSEFVAIMTCSDADKSCPVISGAEYRTTLKYDDPKIYDQTATAVQSYQTRSLQIGQEMLYTFGVVAKLLIRKPSEER